MKKILTLLLLLSTIAAGVHAGEPSATPSVNPADPAVPAPASESELARLSSEVDALKRRASGHERLLAALPAISGYVQTGFEWTDNSSTFFIKRVRLTLAGDIAPRLDYRIQLEFASPKVVDAVLRYRPLEALNFQLGEYKLPFSIENTEYVPLKFELIEYPLALRRLMGFDDICGLSATGRDMGLMAYGGFLRRGGRYLLSYNLGVFNGEGINTRDRNRSKDVVARLTLRPVEGLQIAASGYWGEYGPDYLERIRYGAGACYDRGPVVLRWEYICGTTGLPDAGGTLASDGWYAVGGWRITPKVMAVVRYDTFRENSDLNATRQTDYTGGVLWVPFPRLRCQLNYTRETYAAEEISGRNVMCLMLTGIF
ncbi:porin [uncultured Alistipes sp.]|uniref:porin n=1 Tax=uncultured Alistipes sp. TaxID=538949 RepID=UPI00263244AA|nr:porin [uncultured Alistipes sp.]